MATVFVDDVSKLPKRRDFDFYATHPDDARRGLDFLWDTIARVEQIPFEIAAVASRSWKPTVLDPGAGDGVWGDVLRERYNPSLLVGIELRQVERPASYDYWAVGDFLTEFPGVVGGPRFDLIIGNPPYSDGGAEAFVRRSLALLSPGGYLLFLMRLTFLESKKRAEGLFQEFPPVAVAVCGRRPSFSGNGKTSPDAYAFLCWQEGYQGETRLTWV